MFERALHRIIEQGIATLDASPPLLRRFLAAPGWLPEEIEKIATSWKGKGHPSIVHNFAKAAASLPCYAIVLSGENESDEYLGRSEGAIMLDEVATLVDQIQTEIGRRVNVNVRGFQFTYQVFTYAENPDITLAYHNVLRAIFLGADKKLLDFGFERPTFSGMDLTNMPPYLPENVFARVFQVVGYAHLLTATDLDLSPWDKLFSRIDGLHVANAVTGVDARVVSVAAE